MNNDTESGELIYQGQCSFINADNSVHKILSEEEISLIEMVEINEHESQSKETDPNALIKIFNKILIHLRSSQRILIRKEQLKLIEKSKLTIESTDDEIMNSEFDRLSVKYYFCMSSIEILIQTLKIFRQMRSKVRLYAVYS